MLYEHKLSAEVLLLNNTTLLKYILHSEITVGLKSAEFIKIIRIEMFTNKIMLGLGDLCVPTTPCLKYCGSYVNIYLLIPHNDEIIVLLSSDENRTNFCS